MFHESAKYLYVDLRASSSHLFSEGMSMEHGADQQAQGLHYQLVEHVVDSQAAGQVHLGEAKAHIAGQLLSDVSGQQPKGAEGAQQRLFIECTVLAVKLCMPILAAELIGQLGMGILMKVMVWFMVIPIWVSMAKPAIWGI